ncbi:MAG TPA: AmmeMemoRadiSam system protein A [Ignavibacteriaceae bacterium]|nr:AmmeMemoRadiSam system protein A [Ignavibacteriaceae bacterium]
MGITEEEKGVLLLAARESIGSLFNQSSGSKINYQQYPFLKNHLGAFVTLRIDGELRGCIGYVLSQKTLLETVCEAAKQSAFSDPRFLPLTEEEFEKVKIEISILSSPKKIKDYDEVEVGTHGLIIDEGYIHAVLLPQVAIANNFSREQFISALCEKGGLPPDIWKIQKLNLQIFSAQIISEK